MSLDDEDKALTALLYAPLADALPYLRLPHFNDLFVGRKTEADFVADYVEKNGTLPPFKVMKRKFPSQFGGLPRSPEPLTFCMEELTEQLVTSVCTDGADEMQKCFDQNDMDAFIEANNLLSDKLVSIRAPLDSAALDVDDHTTGVLADLDRDAQLALKIVPTGFEPMDRELGGGMRAGMLITLSALVNLGKTYTVCAIAANMRKKDFRALIVPLEMTQQDIAERVLCVEFGLDVNQYIRRIQPDGDTRTYEQWYRDILAERQKLEAAREYDGKVFVRTEPIVTPRLIRSWARELEVDAIFIDAAQDLRPSNPKLGRVEGLYVAIAEMNAISVELRLPIMFTCQLTAEVEKKGISKGNLTNIAWAQAYAQKSHAVFTMLGDRSTATRDVTTDKNRDGQVGRPWQIDMLFPVVSIEAHDLQPVGITLTEDDVFEDITDLTTAVKEERKKKQLPQRKAKPVVEAAPEPEEPTMVTCKPDEDPQTVYQREREERAEQRRRRREKRKNDLRRFSSGH